MEIPHVRRRVHSKVTNSGEQTMKLLLGTKPPQSYSFRSIYSRVRTKITQSYSFRLIYPRVRTKITPYDTHQPTLMSSRYSNVTTSIHELIIRYASYNFRFIILNPTQRTSKSAPRFLPEKQGRKHASTPMHRLPQCHIGNPRVECQDIDQVLSNP